MTCILILEDWKEIFFFFVLLNSGRRFFVVILSMILLYSRQSVLLTHPLRYAHNTGHCGDQLRPVTIKKKKKSATRLFFLWFHESRIIEVIAARPPPQQSVAVGHYTIMCIKATTF